MLCVALPTLASPEDVLSASTLPRAINPKKQWMLCFLTKTPGLTDRVRYAVQVAGIVFVNGIRCDQCKRQWSNGLVRCGGCRVRHYCSLGCRLKDQRTHRRGKTCRAGRLPTIPEAP